MTSVDQVRWLFVDFNAYFASVEQQENPALRGKPVAVVPVMADSTSCIAVSYEAKAYGIKTGTFVGEAKALCPDIILVEARHGAYVRYHHALVEAVDSCIPVEAVVSIDEMVCRLTHRQREIPEAISLAEKIKRTICQRIGVAIRCSIGLAPNRFLAKVASDMQKPDGLTIVRPRDLPSILYSLEPEDLPGIGRNMQKRLDAHGIHTMEELCAIDVSHMCQIWGGVVGERFHSWLRGEETVEPPTHKGSVGHSHVLEPEARSIEGAWRVAQKLTGKAAIRLRKMGYCAGGIHLAVQFPNHTSWSAKMSLPSTQDTPTFLKALSALWEKIPPGIPLWVGVTFFPIVPAHRSTPSLFDNPKQQRLSFVMDQINDKWGRDTAYYAAAQDARGEAPTRIAFTRIPELYEVEDEV